MKPHRSYQARFIVRVVVTLVVGLSCFLVQWLDQVPSDSMILGSARNL